MIIEFRHGSYTAIIEDDSILSLTILEYGRVIDSFACSHNDPQEWKILLHYLSETYPFFRKYIKKYQHRAV